MDDFDYDGHDDFGMPLNLQERMAFKLLFPVCVSNTGLCFILKIMMEILYLLKREAIPKHKLK